MERSKSGHEEGGPSVTHAWVAILPEVVDEFHNEPNKHLLFILPSGGGGRIEKATTWICNRYKVCAYYN